MNSASASPERNPSQSRPQGYVREQGCGWKSGGRRLTQLLMKILQWSFQIPESPWIRNWLGDKTFLQPLNIPQEKLCKQSNNFESSYCKVNIIQSKNVLNVFQFMTKLSFAQDWLTVSSPAASLESLKGHISHKRRFCARKCHRISFLNITLTTVWRMGWMGVENCSSEKSLWKDT